MPAQLHILGSRTPRPAAARVFYCDGGIDEHHRPGHDLELSHWIPNHTPPEFRASTSTAICLRYVERHTPEAGDLVVNNHVDTDGVLSTFVLCHPTLALGHRELLRQAAEVGDFWAYAEPPALGLYELLARSKQALQAESADALSIYRRAHELTARWLDGEAFAGTEIAAEALGRACDTIERGHIARSLHGPRLALYQVPHALDDGTGGVHAFDAPFERHERLLPHARNHRDGQRMQLVAIERKSGWAYDLWVPGYAWAETVGLWQMPGLRSAGSSNQHHLAHAPLTRAFDTLNDMEHGDGHWALADTLSPFSRVDGRPFPIVGAFTHEGQPGTSRLAPERVANVLGEAWPA